VANTAEPAGNLSLSFSFYLAHASNSSSIVPVYESESIQVPPGEFRFSDLSREDLKTEGEPGTGRAQVMARVTITAPAGSNPEDYPVSLEVIEDEARDGESVQPDSKYRLIILPAKRSKLASLGFIPGQKLSYSFFNPNEEGSEPVRVFHTIDFNRDDLRVAGEEGTGRLQVRAGIQVLLMDGSVRPVKLSVSMELVDIRTGNTKGGPYFTGSVTVSSDGFDH
jgi:hypothetical protein